MKSGMSAASSARDKRGLDGNRRPGGQCQRSPRSHDASGVVTACIRTSLTESARRTLSDPDSACHSYGSRGPVVRALSGLIQSIRYSRVRTIATDPSGVTVHPSWRGNGPCVSVTDPVLDVIWATPTSLVPNVSTDRVARRVAVILVESSRRMTLLESPVSRVPKRATAMPAGSVLTRPERLREHHRGCLPLLW